MRSCFVAVSFVAVSRAPWAKLHAFADRLGWTFKWVSSGGNDFNFDYQVSFTEQQVQGEVDYNYGKRRFPTTDAPGVSVFLRDGNDVFHTYSSFGRGIDNRRLKEAGFRYNYTSAGAVQAFVEAMRLRQTVGGTAPNYKYERDVEQFFRHSPAVVRDS